MWSRSVLHAICPLNRIFCTTNCYVTWTKLRQQCSAALYSTLAGHPRCPRQIHICRITAYINKSYTAQHLAQLTATVPIPKPNGKTGTHGLRFIHLLGGFLRNYFGMMTRKTIYSRKKMDPQKMHALHARLHSRV